MLLALDAQESQGLQERAEMLQQNGIRAEFHSQEAVRQLEPALTLPQAGGALLVDTDSQLVRMRNICLPLWHEPAQLGSPSNSNDAGSCG